MKARTVATSMSSSALSSPSTSDHLRVDPRFDTLPACGVVTANGYGGQRGGGPYFDDLSVGDVFDWAPATTLSSGLAAAHQAIVGDRLRVAAWRRFCPAGTGVPARP